MKIDSVQQIMAEKLVGKTLENLEHGCIGEEGECQVRPLVVGKVIDEVRIGMDECREEAGLWLQFYDKEIFVYDNEAITVR